LLAIGILMLVMLLLPPLFVQQRTPGRANDCRNNMRNFALAVLQFEANRNYYPGYREDIDRTPAISPDDDRSWIFATLPYMDNRAIYESFRPGPNADVNHIMEVAICKAMPPEYVGAAANSYVANCGLLDVTPVAYGRSYDSAANGVFHDRSARVGVDVPIVTVTSNYVADGDGLSHTLMISESVDAARWTGGPTGITADIVPWERWMGFTWHYADGRPGAAHAISPHEPLGLNVRKGESRRTKSLARGFARPSSFHPQGVNVAFCDGRVRFVSELMSYGVYQALMTPRGKHATYNFLDDSLPEPLPAHHEARQTVTYDGLR
jgi:prepilin-type processing-associated H-X9-DG protein